MSERIADKYLTKYEKARIIGERSLELENGAKPLVQVERGMIDTITIAERELASNKLKMVLRRHLPNGTYEDWSTDELKFNS